MAVGKQRVRLSGILADEPVLSGDLILPEPWCKALPFEEGLIWFKGLVIGKV